MSDKHINTAESAMPHGTPALLAASGDIASTEDKTPGCKIVFTRKTHPFNPDISLVYVRGAWVDGRYAPMPLDPRTGESIAAAPVKATNAPGGVLRQFRLRGALFAYSGHYSTGYVAHVRADAVDDTLAWLGALAAMLEARTPQVEKPKDAKTSTAKHVIPTLA